MHALVFKIFSLNRQPFHVYWPGLKMTNCHFPLASNVYTTNISLFPSEYQRPDVICISTIGIGIVSYYFISVTMLATIFLATNRLLLWSYYKDLVLNLSNTPPPKKKRRNLIMLRRLDRQHIRHQIYILKFSNW